MYPAIRPSGLPSEPGAWPALWVFPRRIVDAHPGTHRQVRLQASLETI
jgi:hypothetical protein